VSPWQRTGGVFRTHVDGSHADINGRTKSEARTLVVDANKIALTFIFSVTVAHVFLARPAESTVINVSGPYGARVVGNAQANIDERVESIIESDVREAEQVGAAFSIGIAVSLPFLARPANGAVIGISKIEGAFLRHIDTDIDIPPPVERVADVRLASQSFGTLVRGITVPHVFATGSAKRTIIDMPGFYRTGVWWDANIDELSQFEFEANIGGTNQVT